MTDAHFPAPDTETYDDVVTETIDLTPRRVRTRAW